MKPWDEMNDQERVEWHEQLGESMSPEEAAAFAKGVLQNPEALAEARRLLAEHDAATASQDQPAPNATPPDQAPVAKPKKLRKRKS